MVLDGQYSRAGFHQIFSEAKRYVGTRLQEGVPWVDADMNDFADSVVTQLRRVIQQALGNVSPNNGFKIAEADLEIRGPGELLGLAQHGLDTTFRAADLIRDLKLMQRARGEALLYFQDHPDTPLLEVFQKRFGENFEWARF